MANLVIMVHSQFFEDLLKGLFGRLPLNTIIVPYKEALVSVENHPTLFQQNVHEHNLKKNEAFLPAEKHPSLFQQNVHKHKLKESDIDYILIESNYGSPATESINQTLFDYILTNCPEAEIFAFSGTANSLVKALEHHARISAICKDATFLSELSAFGLQRVMTLPDLKRLIDPNNRRASAPPMVTPLEDSSILVGSPTTRHRSASEPTAFTPYYNAYSEPAAPVNNYASTAIPTAPVNNYASTATPTATVTDYTPGTSSDVQKMRF